MSWQNYISTDPKVLYGKPVIINTRISVELIVDKLSTGESMDDLLAAYPRLSLEAIYAALAFASEAIKNQKVYAVAS